MSNKFKFILVAMTSFAMGAITTIYYNQSTLDEEVLTPRQKELQAIAIEAQNRPFFPTAAPIGNSAAEEQ